MSFKDKFTKASRKKNAPVETKIKLSLDRFKDLSPQEKETLQKIFDQALVNTDKQLTMMNDGTAYVKTGDIPAEWLRDACAQVRPWLFDVQNPNTADKIKAVIERQAKYIDVDPYANAFREDYRTWDTMFELDSLSYSVLLPWTYWKMTGDDSVFTPAVKKAFDRILETMETEQDHQNKSKYTYTRSAHSKNPVGYTGMIWSAFRPSDDACEYNFLIPANMQAVQALTALAEMETHLGRKDQAARAQKLGAEVQAGIEKFGTVTHPKYGKIYAYEVDGLGNANLMDDANIPSLLAIPYMGYAKETDPVYQATRKFILSKDNPYFYSAKFEGEELAGIGSPHTQTGTLWSLAQFFVGGGRTNIRDQIEVAKTVMPGKKHAPGMIWPLAQVAQALTTTDKAEQAKMLKMLAASDPGDNQLHESYAGHYPRIYTRKDFGWPNALFAEFCLTALQGKSPLPVPKPPRKGGVKRIVKPAPK